MVAEHSSPITSAVGHPKSFYLDQFAESDHFLLETCMYFPFVTAKAMVGFGEEHSRFMRVFPRLQMILVLACDEVSDHNRVTIDGDGRPVVHYPLHPGDDSRAGAGRDYIGEDLFRGLGPFGRMCQFPALRRLKPRIEKVLTRLRKTRSSDPGSSPSLPHTCREVARWGAVPRIR